MRGQLGSRQDPLLWEEHGRIGGGASERPGEPRSSSAGPQSFEDPISAMGPLPQKYTGVHAHFHTPHMLIHIHTRKHKITSMCKYTHTHVYPHMCTLTNTHHATGNFRRFLDPLTSQVMDSCLICPLHLTSRETGLQRERGLIQSHPGREGLTSSI